LYRKDVVSLPKELDMKSKKIVISFLVFLLLGLASVGCDRLLPHPTNTPIPISKLATQSEQPDIRGKITAIIVTGGKINAIQIEGVLEKDTKYDKASVRITDKTRVFKLVGDSYQVASLDELINGQTVEVLFTGMILERYPVSVEAEEILIFQ